MKFGPLPIRIVVGIALILHGWAKLSNFAGAHGFFSGLGLPSELLLPITMLEVFGGFENIFKIMRIDYVFTFRDGQGGRSAIRFGFKRTLARTDD